jgi:Heterokaryon incompatibility protein (HET)
MRRMLLERAPQGLGTYPLNQCHSLGTLNEMEAGTDCLLCRWISTNLEHVFATSCSEDRFPANQQLRLCMHGEIGIEIGEAFWVGRIQGLRGYGYWSDLAELRYVSSSNESGEGSEDKNNDNQNSVQIWDSAATLIERAKHSLNLCLEGDSWCERIRTQMGEIVGFRLIDTIDRVVVEAPPMPQYLALSYVWGGADIAQSLKNLPRTIEDAMRLCKELGFRYLWVDALCVPKADPALRLQQIRQMDKIYTNATAVIIAASGPDGHAGLDGISDASNPHQSIRLDGVVVDFVDLRDRLESISSFSPWNTRAWTFQEVLLARRRLVFTKQGFLFECGQESLYRAGDRSRMPYMFNALQQCNPSRTPDLGTFRTYGSLLRQYLSMNLTHQSDIVDAFQGIANRLDKCCWTLPRSWFSLGLRWYSNLKPDEICRKSLPKLMPTWLWAAWDLKDVLYGSYIGETDQTEIADWPEEIWQETERTGILSITAHVVDFGREASPRKLNSQRLETMQDAALAWENREGSFVSLPHWGGTSGRRFTLLVYWKNDIAYRMGNFNVREASWIQEEPVEMKIKLG